MKRYECLFIVSADMDGEGTSRVTKKVQEYLQANGGEVANVQHWGKRKLAYLINKQRYGAFVLMHFSGESPDLAAFQHELELDGEIMAYMTVRLDKFPDFDSLTIPQAYDTERKRGDRGDRRPRDRDEASAPRAEAKPAAEAADRTESAEADSKPEASDEAPAEAPATEPEADAVAEETPEEPAEAATEEAAEEVTEEATEEVVEEKTEEAEEAPAPDAVAETEPEDAGEEVSEEPAVEEAPAEEETAEADDEKEGE